MTAIQRSSIRVLFILLACGLGFAWIRSHIGFVWDDSARIVEYTRDVPPSIGMLFESAFGKITPSGYRPVTEFFSQLSIAYFAPIPGVWFFIAGVLIAFMAMVYFRVARHCLGQDRDAFLATTLFICAPCTVAPLWIAFAGLHALVVLWISGALLLYWRGERTPERRSRYWSGLIALMIFAPWIREFLGLIPVLVILLEWQRRKALTPLMAVCGIMLVHALFPTTIFRWFMPDLPAGSIFSFGSLGDQVARKGTFVLSSIRWAAIWYFIVLLPLSLMLGLFAVAACRLKPRRTVIAVAVGVLAAFVLGWIFQDHRLPALSLVVLMLAAGFRQGFFLGCWFALSYLPFLKIFGSQVHLMYALMPWAIITAGIVAEIREGWVSRISPRLRKYVIGVFLVLICDHAFNLIRTAQIMSSVYDGSRKVAAWFVQRTPKGSIVVSNALQGEDVRLHSNGHIRNIYAGGSIRGGLTLGAELEALLAKRGGNEVYFLELIGAASHNFVHWQSVELESLGTIHTTLARYFYLDPLRMLVPAIMEPFMGPPDQVHDFYVGPQTRIPSFFHEVYGRFQVYRVLSDQVWVPRGEKIPIADYRGFRIFTVNGRYFAIPKRSKKMFLNTIYRYRKYKSFFAVDLDGLYQQIDHWLDVEGGRR